MKGKTSFGLAWPVVLAAGALALGVPAHAAAPYTETVAETVVDVLPCDGFDAVLERTFSGHVTVFFDEEGNPLRLQVLVRVTGSLANASTGTALPLHGHVRLLFDFRAGTDTFVGAVFIATQVGGGSVVKDVGRIVFSGDDVLFEAGPHDAIASEGQALCDALA